ncbi:MAG: hypothetical protein WC477_00200 [Patescibacteria group bacterium]
MIEDILLSFGAFIAFLLVHWTVFHFRNITHRYRTVQRLSIVFLAAYTLSSFLLPHGLINDGIVEIGLRGRIVSYLNGALLYLFLYFSYAQFYFLIDRGVSARMMVELSQLPNGTGTFETVASAYVPERLLRRRVDDMLYGGYLTETNGTLVLTKKGWMFAKLFGFWKKFIHLYPGG